MTTIWQILASIGIGYSVAIVSIGAMLIGFVAGVISVIFVNQRRSIMGDTIAHSTLPGVIIAFFFVLHQNSLLLLIGGLVSGLLSVLFILLITKYTVLKQDAAIGIALSFFFSIGIASLTYVQRLSSSSKSGLSHFLFGNITFLLISDLRNLAIIGGMVLFIMLLFWKEYKLMIFDRNFAISIGIPINKLETLIIVLATITIVISIQVIGVVLVAGLLISPAVAARQWTNNYNQVVFLSGTIGLISGLIGVYLSKNLVRFPPGPGIITILTLIVFLSIIFGRRNIHIWTYLHNKIFHRSLDHSNLLGNFLAKTNNLEKQNGLKRFYFEQSDYPELSNSEINLLISCGYCVRLSFAKVTLTSKGITAVQNKLDQLGEKHEHIY
jgi:manganese/zinc/iron transport system permease protein